MTGYNLPDGMSPNDPEAPWNAPYREPTEDECISWLQTKKEGKIVTVHHLKTWPIFFEFSRTSDKMFEVRLNDRDFKVGDIVILEEYYFPGDQTYQTVSEGRPRSMDTLAKILEGRDGKYTGRKLARTITYIFDNPRFCAPGYVVLGLK